MRMSDGVVKERECEAAGQAGMRLGRILDFHLRS